MTRCIGDAKPELPDTTISTGACNTPKIRVPVHASGFSGGSVSVHNGASTSPVSSTNGYSNGINGISDDDEYDEGIGDDSPTLNEAEPEQQHENNHSNEETNGVVSSSDGWENEADDKVRFMKGPLYPKPNEAIPLPPPPSYTGQANGGNSSFLVTKADAVVPPQKAASYSNNWISNSSSRNPGDVGLTNLGNTCFLNSGLQCLLHSGGLVEYFLNCKFKENSDMFSLLRSFQIVIQQVWSGRFDVIPLSDFRHILGGSHPHFKDGRQHDCQEFLVATLDSLHEQLKKWHAEEFGPPPAEKKAISNGTDAENPAASAEVCEDEEMSSQNDDNQVDIQGSFDCSEEVSSSTSPAPAPFVITNIRSHAKFGSKKVGRKAASSLHKERKLLTSVSNAKQSSLKTSDVEGSTNDSHESLVGAKHCRKKVKTEPPSDEETSTKKIKVDGNHQQGPNNDSLPESKDKAVEDEEPMDITQESAAALTLPQLKEKVNDYWSKYMGENDTAIASTFQGVYKSTVICSECKYVSITYEPFMYLSLPIPRVTTKELRFKLVDMKNVDDLVEDHALTLDLTDNVAKLKEEIFNNFAKDKLNTKASDYAVSEVVNNYVSRYLEDNICIRDFNDSVTNIYVYELNDNFTLIDGNPDSNDDQIQYATFYAGTDTPQREPVGHSYLVDEDTDLPPLVEVEVKEDKGSGDNCAGSCAQSSSNSNSADEKTTESTDPVLKAEECTEEMMKGHGDFGRSDVTCCICLENDSNLDFRKHISCGCVICKDCVKRGAEHYSKEKKENISDPSGINYIKCPICMLAVEHVKEFVPFKPNLDPFLRMQLITIVFRCDSDSNNNSASSRLFGAPCIVRMPSCIPTSEFNGFITSLNFLPQYDYKVVIVDSKGTRCAHCVYTEECHGCDITIREREGNIYLSAINTLAICFSNINDEDIAEHEPLDMMKGCPPSKLYSSAPWLTNTLEPQVDIHDCLTMFSESESLDQQNGWFCPRCKKNQCATKSMSVCKFPDYLIVYLKRFVFVDNSSIKLNNKLSFPLTDLDLKSYIAEECSESNCTYDLYACVCHYGSASAGHYTAFGKNPVTQKWSYFNDATITPNGPSESDYSSAYVLFYQRKDVSCNIPPADSIKVLSMPSPVQVACVAPYQQYGPASSFLKNSPPQAAVQGCSENGVEEIGHSATSSSNDVPQMTGCDTSKRLKSTDSVHTNGVLEDEDQENHRLSKLVNGYDSGDSDGGVKTYGLSRKGKLRAPQNINGEQNRDAVKDS